MPLMIAHIALKIPSDNLYSYLVPPHLVNALKPGYLVCVPLKSRETIGLVVEIENIKSASETGDKGCDARWENGIEGLKEIIAIPYPEPILDEILIDLAKWMSEYYFSPIGLTIRSLIPGGAIPEQTRQADGNRRFRPKGREKLTTYIKLARPKEEITAFIESHKKKAHRQCQILQVLLGGDTGIPVNEIFQDAKVSSSTVKGLIKSGLIESTKERRFRNPFAFTESFRQYKPITLTPEQIAAMDELTSALKKREFAAFLLHGITGSGKTEIYLRLVLNALDMGLQSIILVPEISITHQFIDRFKYYLRDRIAIQHSSLSDGERLDEWHRIREGFADVVIGARSAIFAPFKRLGVIICDEEHDTSYKQESQPKYHGRDVAIMRALKTGCLACLGSATPSLESFYNCQIKKYSLLSLSKRVTTHSLPSVRMIDMREEYTKEVEKYKGIPKDGKFEKEGENEEEKPQIIFSETLFNAIKETVDKKGQVLIFQNRRGHSPFLLCPKCGYVPKCPNCSVSLTYHLTDKIVRCHYCGFQKPPQEFCINCKGAPLRYMGFGTQKIETEINRMFPGFRVVRMDRDTTSRKGAHHKILGCLEKGETDILVGTQMITKGLDLPNITLVGVIGADYILHLPDFRATERVFQMVTQVSGRAGRGNEPGRVLIQTFYPDHYSIFYASNHDYLSFYTREIGFRRRLMYPPFSRMISIIIKGKDRKITRKGANLFGKMIKIKIDPKETRCLGPSMAPLFRIKNNYRYQIMIKAKNYRTSHTLVRDALKEFSGEKDFRQLKIEVDVDPINFL